MAYHDRAGAFMRAHLGTLVDDFRRHGRQIAVVRYKGNRRLAASYGEVAMLAGRFAALLEERGIVPGDRVLLWAENSAEWIAAFHGCILRGALAVPLDAYGSAEFAQRVAADVAAKLAVGDGSLVQQLPTEIPKLGFESWQSELPQQAAGPVAGLDQSTPLQILFTSGTTGEPKGIVHTHGNVLSSIGPIEEAAHGYLRYERLVHPLRFLHTLPLSHVFGQTMGLWIPPIFAAEVHLESRLIAPRLIETIRKEKISVLAAVPRVHALLKTHLEMTYPGLDEELAAAGQMPAWKRWWRFRKIHSAFGFKFWALISGGGALAAPLEEFWNRLGFVLVQGYGMTETTALITLNHPFHVARGTLGKPLAGREVRLGPDGEVLVRGRMISPATWLKGALQTRHDEWLATGDLAEQTPSGELRFVGRKSEVIVTAAGVNLHPEDLEAAIEEELSIVACAVVPVATASGPEPCAVVALRGLTGRASGKDEEVAAEAIERANRRLAEFQRLRRWAVWPEPDLPRTSTGKVRRKAVAEWLSQRQTAAIKNGAEASVGEDWLLALIATLSGENPPGAGDELKLAEDLHLDSLGRVQLAAALEERLGLEPAEGVLDGIETLGQLRRLLAKDLTFDTAEKNSAASDPLAETPQNRGVSAAPAAAEPTYFYPHWPWLLPFRWLRTGFTELVLRPLVRLLAAPAVSRPERLEPDEPLLIVSNHVTAYDGPLIQYALPGAMRRRIAAAMSAEMLDDFLHFRNPEHGPRYGRFMLFGPVAYLLLTVLFNVFPLPRRRDFQRSFAHAGEALDNGFHVLVFPEGTRSAEGALAAFRPGIGVLVRASGAAVLPVALSGLGELKTGRKKWFRSGLIEVRVGQPIRFSAAESESAITERLHAEVKALLEIAG